MPTVVNPLPNKKRQPRTSEHLGEAEKTFRNLKQIAKFGEDHPNLFKVAAVGVVGLLLYLSKRD